MVKLARLSRTISRMKGSDCSPVRSWATVSMSLLHWPCSACTAHSRKKVVDAFSLCAFCLTSTLSSSFSWSSYFVRGSRIVTSSWIHEWQAVNLCWSFQRSASLGRILYTPTLYSLPVFSYFIFLLALLKIEFVFYIPALFCFCKIQMRRRKWSCATYLHQDFVS